MLRRDRRLLGSASLRLRRDDLSRLRERVRVRRRRFDASSLRDRDLDRRRRSYLPLRSRATDSESDRPRDDERDLRLRLLTSLTRCEVDFRRDALALRERLRERRRSRPASFSFLRFDLLSRSFFLRALPVTDDASLTSSVRLARDEVESDELELRLRFFLFFFSFAFFLLFSTFTSAFLDFDSSLRSLLLASRVDLERDRDLRACLRSSRDVDSRSRDFDFFDVSLSRSLSACDEALLVLRAASRSLVGRSRTSPRTESSETTITD